MIPRTLLWMGSNVCSNLALEYTSLTENNIIYATTGLWSLLFAVLWGVEPAGKTLPARVLGGVITVLGAAVASIGDSAASDSGTGKSAMMRVLGDVICFASNAFFGAYIVSLRIDDVCEKRPFYFFSLLGSRVAVLFVIPLAVLFVIPLAVYLAIVVMLSSNHSWDVVLARKTGFAMVNGYGRDFGVIAVKSVLATFGMDFFLAQAAIYTTPTVASIGISFSIPLAFLVDVFIKKVFPVNDTKAVALQVTGALIVVVGFVIAALFSEDDHHDAKKETTDDNTSPLLDVDNDDDDTEACRGPTHENSKQLVEHPDGYTAFPEDDGTLSTVTTSETRLTVANGDT